MSNLSNTSIQENLRKSKNSQNDRRKVRMWVTLFLKKKKIHPLTFIMENRRRQTTIYDLYFMPNILTLFGHDSDCLLSSPTMYWERGWQYIKCIKFQILPF